MHEGGGRWVGSNKLVELKKKKKKRKEKLNGESELKNGHPKGGNGKTEYEWVSYFCSV